jgi:triacylglycerol lipase
VNQPHHLVLIPGFFGFANLGDFTYFGHVRDLLADAGPALGLDGEVLVVRTEPTASLPRRAALVCETVATLLDRAPGAVSLVGHSSGGLDARLLVSPGVALPTGADVERCARAVRAVVTLSTPHHGTPLAQAFGSLLGQQALRLLSLTTIHALRTGRLPLSAVLKLAHFLRFGRAPPSGVLEQLYQQLLADFTVERRRAVEAFLAGVRTDQGLVGQLTPAGMELFNASTEDRPGLPYGCVVTRARPPGLRSLYGAGFDPYAQATHALFVALYRFASGTPPGWLPRLDESSVAVLRRAYGRIPPAAANDGIVPTLSQVRGALLHAAWGDHHDVLGHFKGPTHVPPHFDWVASGSGFDRPHFEALWEDVAAFLADPKAARRGAARVPAPAPG